jgi:hypothetical protein
MDKYMEKEWYVMIHRITVQISNSSFCQPVFSECDIWVWDTE